MPLPDFPPVRFLGSSFLGEVTLRDLDPETVIPLERPGGDKASFFPLLTYFQGIEKVIRKSEGAALLTALESRLGRPAVLSGVHEIRIYSEKHGSDYHPAKIEVQLRDLILPFVMNVALTERGRWVLDSEFQVLDGLKRKYRLPYLPTAYFMEETPASSGPEGAPPLRMVLADWLEGFYEFHLSVDPADGSQKLVLWDTAEQNRYLPAGAADQIYREVSRILTSYYDLRTFSQIYPWHLAAGDFIAKFEFDRVAVRLVAARRYGPLIGPPDLPPEEALLFFLLNLSIRIRLDRLDGVGDLSWADEGCLQPSFEGFFQALAEKEHSGEITPGFLTGFRNYLKSLSLEELDVWLGALLDSTDPSTPDQAVLKRHLDRHRKQFFLLTNRPVSDYRTLI
jgi:hypothetical protein